MKETKEVTWRSLKPGQKIEQYREENRTCITSAIVHDVNSSYVTLYSWWEPENKKKVNSETSMFSVELTEKEIHDKYREDVKEIRAAIHNRLEDYEIGYHEMWNGWVTYDPYELASYCRQEKFKIVGHHELAIPKHSFCGLTLDMGIVAEYENGERFWCHTSKDIIDYLGRDREEDV